MLLLIAQYVLIFCAVFYFSLHPFHMLQLNSYRLKRYFKWYRANLRKWYALPFTAVFILLAFLQGVFGLPLAPVLLLPAVIRLILRQNQKTKFVVTARVKRLLCTFSVLLGTMIVLSVVTGGVYATVFTAALYFIVPLCVAINSPIEKLINNGYINDARRILSSRPDLVIVGITGSYGKTSVKHILGELLSEKYNTLITPGSFNTTLGVVRTVREYLRPSHQAFVVEMGAKQRGDIRQICEIVRPKYGILTSIGPQHLETFKSVDNVVSTKFELIDALPGSGMAVLNYDNSYIKGHMVNTPSISVTTGENGDYRVKDLRYGRTGIEFKLATPNGEEIQIKSPLLGRHNALNIALAAAMALHLGVTPSEIAAAARRLKPAEHRLQLKPSGNITLIDDAYNSNPEGAKAALDVLSAFDCPMRILVTPGMVELGSLQEEKNREFGAYAAKTCDYAILVGEKQAPPILKGLTSAGFPEDKIFIARDINVALSKMYAIAPPGAVALLENDLPDNFL